MTTTIGLARLHLVSRRVPASLVALAVVTVAWLWPARPAGDGGAAICAGLVFAAGLAAFTVRGASRLS